MLRILIFLFFSLCFHAVSVAKTTTRLFEFHIADGWGGAPLGNNHVRLTDKNGIVCLDTLVNDRFTHKLIVKKNFTYLIWIENNQKTFHKVLEQEFDYSDFNETSGEITFYVMPTKAYQQWIWQREDSIYGSIKDLDTSYFYKKTELKLAAEAYFRAGIYEMQHLISKHINYPDHVVKDDFKNGMVYIKFVVELDGNISHISVLRGVDQLCDEEAMRVTSFLNGWEPAVVDGRKVRMYYGVPINFKLL